MDDDNRVRMARPDAEDAQGHTIVGGRPAGRVSLGRNVPRAMEALVKKAAVDPAFLERLIVRRSNIAPECGVTLDPAETAMLDGTPEPQLRAIVASVCVPDCQRSVLAGAPATAIVALLAQLALAPVAIHAETSAQPSTAATHSVDAGQIMSKGIRPDLPAVRPQEGEPTGGLVEQGIRPEMPVTRGIRPDFPMVTKGITPDLPPDVVPLPTPRPAPSQEDQTALTRQKVSRAVVLVELSGQPFAQAVEELGRSVGVQIRVDPRSAIDLQAPVRASTKGHSLKRALRRIMHDVAPGRGLELSILGDVVTVRTATGAAVPSAFTSPGEQAPASPASPSATPGGKAPGEDRSR